jgi:hypothetical protein
MLALWLWGLDVLVWRKARINHVFIFNFNPTTALLYHSVFTVCHCAMQEIIVVIEATVFVCSSALIL